MAGRPAGMANNNNKQAQLSNAYQELAKELASEKLKIVGGYTLGRVIGEGTYGSVHLATHRTTGTRCAIKKIPKTSTPQLTREIHHHRRLHHPNIVHLHEILATESHVWLVSELCSGGELFDYLVERGRLLEGEARRLFGELTVAVGYMHKQGVVHRDLKLENVLLDGEMRIKLGDLGFAREWQKGRLMDTFCGTTGYASPEMLAGRKYLGEETDVWSLGIILYILLCGGLPFDDDDENVMKSLIMKGEYEEPEWFSDEARALVRGMLQQDPTKRLTIEQILTHPWFRMTIVDNLNPNQSPPATPNPTTPLPDRRDSYFQEPFSRGDPGPSSSRYHSSGPSPLTMDSMTVPPPPGPESEPSETKSDFNDSETGKPDSGITTPTTVDEVDMKRVHSGEFSQTERDLELLHPNTSQSTITRRGDESPGSSHGAGVKARVAMPPPLAGQREVDEDALEDDSPSLPILDDHLHLPLAQHSRTPSRTKRRSVSSTMSLERKLSHHSQSGQWQSYSPEDYLARLNEKRQALFTRPSEKHLLNQLSDLGFDTGQLVHSVTNDACDASAAAWWILRQKQMERGETDDVIEARHASAARRRERAAAFHREERRKARAEGSGSAPKDGVLSTGVSRDPSPNERVTGGVTFVEIPEAIPATPSFHIMDLGAPVGTSQVTTPEEMDRTRLPVGGTEKIGVQIPKTPPRDVVPLVETSPRVGKTRSPSMSMLQRATSAFVGKKDEKEKEKDKEKTHVQAQEQETEKKEGRSTSPTKLIKPPPKAKMPRGESEANLLTVPKSSPGAPASATRLVELLPPSNSEAGPSSTPMLTPSTSTSSTLVPSEKAKVSKRDSLWSTFRYLFNEEKRRAKRGAPSPLRGEVEIVTVPPAVVLSRGIAGRAPHVNRVPNPPLMLSSRRASLEGRPIYSRRSSSVNSRRSSVTSMHLPSDFHDTVASVGLGLGRRSSQRSHGSHTPTSEREHDYEYEVETSSRPGSSHSISRGGGGGGGGGGSRRSSSSLYMRSPTLQSDISASSRFRNAPGVPASPLHNYHRRRPNGSDSTRVRHFKVIPETQILRPGYSGSVASSVRSNASSRASSVERKGGGDRDKSGGTGTGESDYDTGKEDSLRFGTTGRRKKSDGGAGSGGGGLGIGHASLAQQIHHRTRSPLVDKGKKKAPLRDVFQKGDDEWVDEDEKDGFVGGLGQGSGSGSVGFGQGVGVGLAKWGMMGYGKAVGSAAVHPGVHPTGRKKKGHGSGQRRRSSSDEEKVGGKGKVLEEIKEAVVVVNDRERGGRRIGIMPERAIPRAPVIQEEEEEE